MDDSWLCDHVLIRHVSLMDWFAHMVNFRASPLGRCPLALLDSTSAVDRGARPFTAHYRARQCRVGLVVIRHSEYSHYLCSSCFGIWPCMIFCTLRIEELLLKKRLAGIAGRLRT